MTLTTRTPARVGATALLATGVLAALVTPALAGPTTLAPAKAAAVAPAKLSVTMSGLTVAEKASGKFSTVTVRNTGTTAAKDVGLVFFLGDLDRKKVTFASLKDDASCEERATIEDPTTKKPIPGGPFILCNVGTLDGGQAAKAWPFQLSPVKGATAGPAGKLTAVALNEDGLSAVATKPVAIGGSGVDLAVFADDVYSEIREEEQLPVKPGKRGVLYAYVQNQGDQGSSGVKFTVALPKGVTLAEAEPDCVFSADKRTATCNYSRSIFLPADQDKDKESPKDGVSAGWFYWVVNVAKDVKAPTLTGGAVKVDAIQQQVGAQRAPGAPTAVFPKNFSLAAPVGAKAVKDVDPTDNADTFNVFVDVAKGGAGGGGTLPVTGAQAGVIGGTGLVALLAGAVMFFLARRRRVVMVAPRDEKLPTA
ncbi:MAG TPA: hypothetical protein VF755_24835 [Catenuloplanes sp.]|jgi:LPXTG-motif cell wall-anchored protein